MYGKKRLKCNPEDEQKKKNTKPKAKHHKLYRYPIKKLLKWRYFSAGTWYFFCK